MRVLLISGGFIDNTFAAKFLGEKHFDKIIAVDGGLETASQLGLKGADTGLTDIVGDFDTVCPKLLEQYRQGREDHGPVIHQFNPEKDYTDTDIALRLAMDYCKNPGSEIWILGATGSRLDHVLANITMLLLPFERKIPTWIVDPNNRICLISGKKVIEKSKSFGKYMSLIPLTKEISKVTLTGVKYPLYNHTVTLGESLCVSNEIIGREAVIEVGEGIAILLETKD